MPRDDATLLDIARAARLIQSFIAGMTKDDFLAELKTQSAVLHQLTILGEAVKRLSRPFREKHPNSTLGAYERDARPPDPWIRCG